MTGRVETSVEVADLLLVEEGASTGAVTVEIDRYLTRSAAIVEKHVKFHSDQQTVNQFIVVIVSKRWAEEAIQGDLKDLTLDPPHQVLTKTKDNLII